MKDIEDDAEAKEKQVVNKMLYLTMSDLKKAFLNWKHDKDVYKEALRCKKVVGFLDTINFVFAGNAGLAID